MPDKRKRSSFSARILGREVVVRYRISEGGKRLLDTVLDIGIQRILPIHSEFGLEAREMLEARFTKKKE